MGTSGLKATKRAANMDILRIISMLLIILMHSVDHSGVLEAVVPGTGMYYYVYFVFFLVQVCVNCFVLLSGYFLVNSKFRISKLITLWLEVVFYSVLIRMIFFVLGARPFSVMSLISCLVPVVTGRYWFITIYFGLYLLSPFLNLAIKAMNKRQFTAFNLILFVLMSAWSSIHPTLMGMNSGGGWGLAWFVVLYCAAAWFKLYRENDNRYRYGGLLVYLVMLSLVMVCLWLANTLNIGIALTIISRWYAYDSVPVYLMSLGLLDFFIHVEVKSEFAANLIRKIAPLTLGVFLIHHHADISQWMWSALNLPQYMDTAVFPLIQISVTVAIFAVCTALDFGREWLFRAIHVDKVGRALDQWAANVMGIEL